MAAKLNAVESRQNSKESRGQEGKEKSLLPLEMTGLCPTGDGFNKSRLGYETQKQDVNENQSEPAQKTRAKSRQKVTPTKKPMQKKMKKNCEFCSRNFKGVTSSVSEIHVQKCKRFHRFIKGENSNQCALCPEKREFSTQGHVFVHLEKRHANQTSQNDLDQNMAIDKGEIPLNDFGENRDGTISQNDLGEDIANVEKIKKISPKDSGTNAEVFKTPETALVPMNYFNDVVVEDPYFTDPRVVTELFVCPLCKGKLAKLDHVESHVEEIHKIDLTTFRSLDLHVVTVKV